MAVAAVISGVATLGSAYVGYQGQKKQAKAAANAQSAAQAAAEKTERNATIANNQANQKQANSSALLSSNEMAAKGGQGGTMLTGPGGVDPNALRLGKTTLLGGA